MIPPDIRRDWRHPYNTSLLTAVLMVPVCFVLCANGIEPRVFACLALSLLFCSTGFWFLVYIPAVQDARTAAHAAQRHADRVRELRGDQ